MAVLADTLARQGLVKGFRDLGVTDGDTLLVHSSFASLGPVEGGVQTLIDALMEAVGSGTLVVPTFNYDWCHGTPFDARKTPSKMGLLSEAVRRNPKAGRAGHPVYSFSALGSRAGEISQIRNLSGFGADSLFAKLMEWDGKIMVVGLSWDDSVTFLHHVEEMEGCGYRHMKTFTGQYTDLDGKTEMRSYRILSRDEGVERSLEHMGWIAEQSGIVRTTQIGQAMVKVVGARDLYWLTARELHRNPRLLVA